MKLEIISISLLDENPFNSRLRYDEDEIVKLAASMDHLGLLSPIKARPKNNSQKYELIFGHRRVRAARYLKWESIPAEVEIVSDE